MLKKLYCDLRARLLGTLRRWADSGRAGRAWGARAGVGAGRWVSGRAAGARGAERAGGRGQARGARRAGRQARGARRAGRRARGALLAGRRPGQAGARQQARARAGWLRAVHSVHSAHFQSVLTRFFPESPNEHCSL